MSASPQSLTCTTHEERTAAEPRDNSLHRVVVSDVKQINERIRVLRLAIPEGRPTIRFLPGQWLDVYVPGIRKPGGFTITSTPSDAYPTSDDITTAGGTRGYLELAVQDSPFNPPAAWLWRPVYEIINQDLHIRVGGSFVWPPPGVNLNEVKRIVFVAGGVGVNPLISIICHLAQTAVPLYEIFFLYSLRDPGEAEDLSKILFVERLAGMFAAGRIRGNLVLHLTPGSKGQRSMTESMLETAAAKLRYRKRRISQEDLLEALGTTSERQHTVCYICGVPSMTDELVGLAQSARGMDPRKVLFERWW